MAPITIRPPTFSPAAQPPFYTNPSIPWLAKTWHVTHSTLPMWKSKRNVRIAYTPLPPSAPSIAQDNTDRLDDMVTYQSLSETKVQSVHGVDKAAGGDRGAWDWRGKGWLVIASSHWEVLGWGEEEGGNKWVVTMFAKTLFTPAGLDVYSLRKEGASEETLEAIKWGLGKVDDEDVREMAGELFVVKVDDARTD